MRLGNLIDTLGMALTLFAAAAAFWWAVWATQQKGDRQ